MCFESTYGHSHCGSAVMNLTSTHEDAGSIPGLAQWVKQFGVAMGCAIDHRHSLDVSLLWLWCGLAARALIQPLAWVWP